jgi:hypothetical protein
VLSFEHVAFLYLISFPALVQYQVNVKLNTAHAMEAYVEVEVQIRSLVTSALGYP